MALKLDIARPEKEVTPLDEKWREKYPWLFPGGVLASMTDFKFPK
jgi:hypothetical protein